MTFPVPGPYRASKISEHTQECPVRFGTNPSLLRGSVMLSSVKIHNRAACPCTTENSKVQTHRRADFSLRMGFQCNSQPPLPLLLEFELVMDRVGASDKR